MNTISQVDKDAIRAALSTPMTFPQLVRFRRRQTGATEEKTRAIGQCMLTYGELRLDIDMRLVVVQNETTNP